MITDQISLTQEEQDIVTFIRESALAGTDANSVAYAPLIDRLLGCRPRQYPSRPGGNPPFHVMIKGLRDRQSYESPPLFDEPLAPVEAYNSEDETPVDDSPPSPADAPVDDFEMKEPDEVADETSTEVPPPTQSPEPLEEELEDYSRKLIAVMKIHATATRALAEKDILTLGDAADRRRSDLKLITGVGPNAIRELDQILKANGLRFAPEKPGRRPKR